MVGRTQARADDAPVAVAGRHEFPEIVVFTGDLVGSSKLSPDALADAMRELERRPTMSPTWSLADPRFTDFRTIAPAARRTSLRNGSPGFHRSAATAGSASAPAVSTRCAEP